MAPVGFEWIVVIWYYATVVVGPVILFALVVLIAVVALRINGRLKRMMPAQTDAGAPLGDASGAAGGSDDDGSAERRRLQDGLEHARRELDLADAGLTRRERTVLRVRRWGRTAPVRTRSWGSIPVRPPWRGSSVARSPMRFQMPA